MADIAVIKKSEGADNRRQSWSALIDEEEATSQALPPPAAPRSRLETREYLL